MAYVMYVYSMYVVPFTCVYIRVRVVGLSGRESEKTFSLAALLRVAQISTTACNSRRRLLNDNVSTLRCIRAKFVAESFIFVRLVYV